MACPHARAPARPLGLTPPLSVVEFLVDLHDPPQLEPQHGGRALRGIAPEIETNRWLDDFSLATRLHVHFDDQVSAGREAPREALGEQRGDLSWRPTQKMAIWVHGGV